MLSLAQFLVTNREDIIRRARARVRTRHPPPTEDELDDGISLFLSQLVDRLNLATPDDGAIEASATKHGADLQRIGFTVAQVVHDYGDICQAVTELALETGAPITVEEFHTLNRCLDGAIAFAVTEHARRCAQSSAEEGTARLGSLAHELRNRLAAATMSFDILKRGRVGLEGATAAILERSLRGLHGLIDLALADVRLESSAQRRGRVAIAKLLEEVGLEASIDASARGLELAVSSGEPGVDVEADPQLLAAAIGNLLQNAFKFTRAGGHVALRTSATAARVLIEIEDECGGLKPGVAEGLFRPFVQHDADRTGLGLGLSISRESVAAAGGDIRVRDLPGKGCVFTIDLPRHASP